MWLIFKNGAIRQFQDLDEKLKKLHIAGDRFANVLDMAKVDDAIAAGEVNPSLPTVEFYDQLIPFMVPGELTPSWTKLQKSE